MPAYFLVIAAVLNISLGWFVLGQNTGARLNRTFFSLMLFATAWISTNFLYAYYVQDTSNSYLYALLSYAMALLLSLSFILFSSALTKYKIKSRLSSGIISLYVVAAILSALPGIVAKGINESSRTIDTNAYVLAVYGVMLAIAFLAGIVMMIKRFFTASKSQKDQIKIIIIGLTLAVAIGMVFNLILPLVGKYDLVQLGPMGTVVFVMFGSYAIVKHGLFDIKQTVIRTIAYIASLATLSLAYFLFVYLLTATIFRNNVTTGVSISSVNIILALILAFIFQPIKQFFDRITDKIFFRDRYSTDEFYSRLSELLASSFDLEDLLYNASFEIGTTLKAEQAFFYVHNIERAGVEAGTKGHSHLGNDDLSLLRETLSRQKKIVVRDMLAEERHGHLYKVLHKHKIAIVMQLVHQREIMGYLVLGDKLSGGYSKRDIKVLETISDELVIAIQNALSIQEVRELNANLQERIKEATKELVASNRKLTKLDETKDEFISMASHQLRTPLTSVKGYISMVLDGDVGEVNKQQRMLLEQAFESSQRMVYLIGDFLNISRLRTGKFVLEPSHVNLAHVVEEEVAQLKDTAKGRGITIKYVKPVNIPDILADDNKLRQVMMNFMDNAVYYTLPGGTVTVELYKNQDAVFFKVKDNGIGVAKAEQAKLFTKFFRAPNARKQRPDGTGIGLYMAKKVVVAHGGAVIFESQEGKGSTFGFRLPLVISKRRFDRAPETSVPASGIRA